MEENTEQQKKTLVPRKGMSDFRKALLWTAIPILILSAIGAPGAVSPQRTWVGFTGILVADWMLFGLSILVCIGFAIARKRQIALGILAGIGIGVVGVGLTCFGALANQPTP